MKKMLSLHELEKAIECQRSRVDAMVYAGMYSEDFMRENRRLDQLINEYIELEDREKRLQAYFAD